MNRLERAASTFTLQRLRHARPAASVGAGPAAGFFESRTDAMASGRLRLDQPKRMLDLGADMRFGGFDQIIQSSLRRIG